MQTLKLSPSLLEQYRLVRIGAYNLTAESLIEYIMGEYRPNLAVSRGTAYHAILEHGGEPYKKVVKGITFYEVYESDMDTTWRFTQEAAQPAINLHSHYKEMTHEVWIDMQTESQGFKILIRMKVDGINADIIQEFKTTGRAKKYLDYYESIQWRCYLQALPEAANLVYNVFQLNKNNTKCRNYQFKMDREAQNELIVQQEIDGLVSWMTHYPQLIEKRLMVENKNPLPI